MTPHAPAPIATAVLAAALLAAPAAAGMEVRAVAQEGAPLAESAGVRLARYAEPAEAAPPAVGTVLAGGDLLASAVAGLSVELGCPDDGLLRLTGPFRVAVLPPGPEAACGVDLLAGAVEVVAVGATEVRSGALVVRGAAARYALRVEPAAVAVGDAAGGGAADPAPPGVRQRVLVLDGAVEVASPAGRSRVGAGGSLTVEAPRGRPDLARTHGGPLAAGELERWAAGEPPWPPADASGGPAEVASAGEPGTTVPPPAASAGPAESTSTTVEPAPAAPGPAEAAAPLDRDRLRRWLEERRYQEVIAAVEPRAAEESLASVDCYLLAEAYAGLRRWDRSALYARRALRLDEVDNLLTSRELAKAQNLQSRDPDAERR